MKLTTEYKILQNNTTYCTDTKFSETRVERVSTSSSSSSLSSLMVRLGGTGGAKGEEVTGTLNFSAAALWACWDRSSICREERRGVNAIHALMRQEKEKETNKQTKTYLCLSKHNVNVWCRAFEHIWSADDKQDALGLSNGDSGHPMDRLQAQFRHGLHTRIQRETKQHKLNQNLRILAFIFNVGIIFEYFLNIIYVKPVVCPYGPSSHCDSVLVCWALHLPRR